MGWRVSGRHGLLGRVVPSDSDRHPHDRESLLVRGGTSEALYYHVPVALVTRIALKKRLVHVDADIADFTAHLRRDGSVDLLPTH
jgi:hypothetical protein